MKLKPLLTIAVVCLFLNGAMAGADDLSDLKQQVEKLEKKIEELEENQKAQTDEIEYMLEQPAPGDVISKVLGERTSIGGHLKFFLADQSIGEVDDQEQNNSFSMGINDLWLYFNKTLTDWLKLTVAPQILVVAEATPALGSEITRSSSADIDIDLDEAYMTVRLPKRFELKVGAFYPAFSDEYSTKSWWHELYHNNNGLVTLEAWQSVGAEVYRNFDFSAFSLPVSLAVVNGEDRGLSQSGRFTDNNHSVTALLHVSPEWFLFGGRLRLMGSAGWGRWDDDGNSNAYVLAAGAEYTRSSLSFSGEYMYRSREDLPLVGGGTEDGTDKGFYLKVKYSLTEKWRFVLKYSDVELWALSTDSLATDKYRSLTAAAGWWITDSSTIIPQIEFVDAEREGSDQTLSYWRYTLGWRTTF